MDSFEWNKVFGAVLSGALLVMVIQMVSGALFDDGGHDGGETKLAYTIEVAEPVAAGGTEVVDTGPSLSELLAAASVEKGARQFAKCKSCHTIDKDGRNGTGPNLYGILGKAVAQNEGFRYSSSLADHGGTWSFELIDAWLASPKVTIPGNVMSFAGIRKPAQRADLIAYMNNASDTPLALPAVEAPIDDNSDAGRADDTTGY